MSKKNHLKTLEQKTYNEFLIDGVTELLAGVVLLFLPVLFLNPIFVAFVPFLIFLSPQLVEYIRQRTTYPRIGRVEFKEEELNEGYSVRKAAFEFLLLVLLILLLTCIFMIVFEGKILEISLWYSWVPFMFGLLMFGPSALLVEKTGRRYYYIFVIFSSLLGLGISLLNFTGIFDGMFLYFYLLGISTIVLGLVRYIWFIRNYPVINLEED